MVIVKTIDPIESTMGVQGHTVKGDREGAVESVALA